MPFFVDGSDAACPAAGINPGPANNGYSSSKHRFCFSVSGRTETDPEALEILRECIRHGLRKKENAFRPLYAAGSPQLWELLTALSIPAQPLAEHAVPPENALIVFDSSGAETVRKHKFGDGTNLLALNLTAEQVASFVPGKFRMETGKHGFSRANGLRDVPVFEGISNADLHFRTTPEFASFEKHSPGGRLLRTAPYGTGRIVFCQLAPWNFNAAQNDERCAIRRSQYLTARLLYNLGIRMGSTISRLSGKDWRIRMTKAVLRVGRKHRTTSDTGGR